MTAFRRKDRPNEGYRIWPKLPKPWGRVGPWQTGMRDKRSAERVQAWLFDQALSRPALIDALVRHEFSLKTAWIAHLRGRLDQLLVGLSDPLLKDAVEAYRPVCQDRRARQGLAQLLEYTPEGARLSWLARKNIATLYAKALETRKPNSVRRSLHRAVAELLLHELGEKERAAALEGVRVPGEDDSRAVVLAPDAVRSVVDAAPNDRFRWLVALAILTTADRKPLLELTTEHGDEEKAELLIPDRKARSRWRVVRLSAEALTVWRLATAGLKAGERVFPWTPWQVRKFWEATRKAAGQPELRFKDLRHLLPTALAAAGVDRREIEALLGHAPGSSMTGRYITPAGTVDRLDAAAARLGLSGIGVRRAG